jgi:hypothetical protein
LSEKIVVPQGMVDAFGVGYDHQKGLGGNRDVCERGGIEAAMRWLAQNPIVPTYEQERSLDGAWMESKRNPFDPAHKFEHATAFGAVEWQRRMFLARPDNREMTVYDCLDCKKSWRQQVREPIESCVYCGSTNTKAIATVSPVREYPLEVR